MRLNRLTSPYLTVKENTRKRKSNEHETGSVETFENQIMIKSMH